MTTKQSTSVDSPMHEWVLRRAEDRPETRAVVSDVGAVTYGELETRSSQLALALRAAGCRRSDRVALLMPHASEAVTAVVAAMKAGCPFVPLDPGAPLTHTAEILRRTAPAAVLAAGCSPELLERLRTRSALGAARIGWLGDDVGAPPGVDFRRSDLRGSTPDGEWVRPRTDELAYIQFSPARSGKPKGVTITHGNIRPFVEWAGDYFDVGQKDRVFGHATLTIDPSVVEILVTLAAGAELHPVSAGGLLHPHFDPAFAEARRLTLWLTLASQLSRVARCDALEGRDLGSLRHVAWCGDVLPPSSLLYWKERLPETAFTNLYGPREATVACSHYRVPGGWSDATSGIPIGRACPGEELLLLDDELRPVADGEVGEIFVTGVGLSRGYWPGSGDPSEPFVPDPRSGNGAVLFRTGDLGRRGEGGTIRFLGRADLCIETSAGRVAPVEVEDAIRQVDGISDCTVLPVRVNGLSEPRVGCAYVSRDGAPLRTDELETSLTGTLPAHMIPGVWLVLDELPVDARGKIDRDLVRRMFGWMACGPNGARSRDAVRVRRA